MAPPLTPTPIEVNDEFSIDSDLATPCSETPPLACVSTTPETVSESNAIVPPLVDVMDITPSPFTAEELFEVEIMVLLTLKAYAYQNRTVEKQHKMAITLPTPV
jgi:hypothetical protein